MSLLLRPIVACIGQRSTLAIRFSYIAIRCKSVQAQVSTTTTVITSSTSKNVKPKEIAVAVVSISKQGAVKASRKAKKKKKKAAAKSKIIRKEPKPSMKNVKPPVSGPGKPVRGQKLTIKEVKLLTNDENLPAKKTNSKIPKQPVKELKLLDEDHKPRAKTPKPLPKRKAIVKVTKKLSKPLAKPPTRPIPSKIKPVTSKVIKVDADNPLSKETQVSTNLSHQTPLNSSPNGETQGSTIVKSKSSKSDAATEATSQFLSPSEAAKIVSTTSTNQNDIALDTNVDSNCKNTFFYYSYLVDETTGVATDLPSVKVVDSGNDKSKNSIPDTTTATKLDPKLVTPVNWSTFLYDVFGTSSNNQVVKLIQPSKYESRVDEYSYETIRSKKGLEMKRNKPNIRGFKFINYDVWTELGVGNYQFDNKLESNEATVFVNNQHLVLAHDSIVPPITIKLPECLNFRNPTGLSSLEQIGRLLTYEYILKWSLMNFYNPNLMWDKFVKSCRGLQFMQLDKSATILFQGLQPLNVFIAMVYIEDKDYEYAILKFLKLFATNHKLDTKFSTELLIDKYKPDLDAYLQQFPAPIDFNKFSQVFRPPLLHSLPIKLPPLPKFHNQELYKMVQISLISLQFMAKSNKLGVLNFLRKRLDRLGDAILKRYSVEYMVHHCKTNPRFRWNMDDVSFINTNIVFSSLSFAYKLHQTINDAEIQANMDRLITSSDLNTANELLGDMFERMVAIEYLDNPDMCRTWIFKMYDAILDNLTKEKDGIEFIDKEKYVKLYEHHLKTKTLY